MKHASVAVSPGRDPLSAQTSVSADSHDPDHDDDYDKTVHLGSYAPMPAVRSPRALKHHSLDEIKAAICQATAQYLISFDKEDFGNAIDELNDSDTCHEIPKIVVSKGLDCSSEKRVALSDLLLYLVNTSRVSPLQVQFAFGRLFNRLNDLMLDVPHAPELLKEFLRRSVAGGYCDSVAAELMSQGAELAQHPEQLREIRPQINKIISDYFCSENDVEEAIFSLKKLNSPEFGHEFIKRLVNAGMDRSNREREAVSQLLAAISTSSAINQVEIEKAFQSILDGMEEIVDDVQDIVPLVACFLVRAICDEVLTPSFLTRSLLGLGSNDLGKNAVTSAQTILSFPSPGVFASAVWDPANSPELKDVFNNASRMYLCDNNHDLLWRIGSIPMFGPILIKRLFVEASSSDASLSKMRRLLNLLPHDIVTKGLEHIRSQLHDLELDVPGIEKKFEMFTADL